jgi:hypothetical protein
MMTRCGLTAALLLVANVAAAHRPYEQPERVIKAAGQQIVMVRYYVDGILGTDPVQLQLRDQAGRTIAQTAFSRDVIVTCASEHRCHVYQYDSTLHPVPKAVWRVDGIQIVPADSRWLYVSGAVIPLWHHWLGYLLAIAAAFPPIVTVRYIAGRPSSLATTLLGLSGGLSSLTWSFIWMLVVAMNSVLCLAWVAPGVALLLVGWKTVRQVLRRSPRTACT